LCPTIRSTRPASLFICLVLFIEQLIYFPFYFIVLQKILTSFHINTYFSLVFEFCLHLFTFSSRTSFYISSGTSFWALQLSPSFWFTFGGTYSLHLQCQRALLTFCSLLISSFSRSVFGRSQVQISLRRPAVHVEILSDSPHTLRTNNGISLRPRQFPSTSFPFTIALSFDVIAYSLSY
jgi:hypothetical protein